MLNMTRAHPRGWKGRVSYGRGQTIHVITKRTEITAKHRTLSGTPERDKERERERKKREREERERETERQRERDRDRQRDR